MVPPMTSKRERKRRRKEAHRRELERREAERKAAAKNCYCGPDQEYCGTCDVCGRPGHVRHFPGAAPYTGSWCDRHYFTTALLHPNGAYGCWLWASALIFGVALLVRLVA